MSNNDNSNWRSRLEDKKNRDRDQIEGFFESRRGQIFSIVAAAVVVAVLGWNIISGLFGSIFGGS